MRAEDAHVRMVRVRIRDGEITKVVEDGLRRSAAFRRLIDRIQDARVFLYIVRVAYLPEKMEGCVPLDTGGAGEDRYLRMLIRSGLGRDRTIAVIGHEAQHVLEILDTPPRANATGPSDWSWGTRMSTRRYETQAALDVGHEIAAELRSRVADPKIVQQIRDDFAPQGEER